MEQALRGDGPEGAAVLPSGPTSPPVARDDGLPTGPPAREGAPARAAREGAPARGDEAGPRIPVPAGEDPDETPVSRFATAIRPLGTAPTLADLPSVRRGPVPVGLTLPSIGVADAEVVPVGVEPDGAMEIPGATGVGWYRHGVLPGDDAGSAVLAAHIAWNGRDGVFRRLTELAPGDTVEVRMDDGARLAYTVVGTRQYPKEEVPLEDLFARSGSPRLVLITCGGVFDRSADSYADNVVVVAVPVTG